MLTAIFGGTFNPLHIGHYEILRALNEDPNIGKILLMPDAVPPHKKPDYLPDDDTRIEMCRIAAGDFEKCEVSLIEFQRSSKSYTYDTVKILKHQFPDTDFAFVMGGDMLISFGKWYKYSELIKMLTFIVFTRASEPCEEFDSAVRRFESEGMRLILKENVIPEISSTQLRKNIDAGREFLPDRIYEFLKRRGVYEKQ